MKNVAAPCIKRRSPRTETRFGLLWPVPTPDDAHLDSADVLLFQFAFSPESYDLAYTKLDTLLIRKFMGSYGGYICSAALRHAILAFAACSLPPAFERQRIRHTILASQELRKQKVDTIDDSHLLTAYLLSSQSGTSKQEMIAHAKGMVAIFNILQSSVHGNTFAFASNTPAPACFRPYFLEMVLPGGICVFLDPKSSMLLCQSISTPFATWDERVQLQYLLYDIPRQSSSKETVFEILYWDLCDIISLIELFQERRDRHMEQWNSYLDKLLARWKSDVESSEGRELLLKLDEAISSDIALREEDAVLLKDACMLCASVKLLILMLEGATMLEALRSPEAVSLSLMLLSFIRLHKGRVKWGRRQSPAQQLVFLGGLALTPNTFPNSLP